MHLPRVPRRPRRITVVIGTLAVATLALLPAAGRAEGAAHNTRPAPVNLSTKINTHDGKAKQNAIVSARDARFEVLAPDVIRMEYSPTGTFLDQPTFNVLNRNLPVPPYTVHKEDGWLTITTSQMVLSYQLGSGPFSTLNTKLQLLGMGTSVMPSWEWECTYGQVCQAGSAALSGGAALATNHNGYVSPAGFVDGYSNPGDDASWQLLGAPAGPATVTIRYSNYIGAIGGPAPRTMTLDVNGTATQVTLPPTSSWDDWSTITEPVTLQAGTNNVAVDCATGDDCNVNIDDISVTAPNETAAPVVPAGHLGGYIRSFDAANGTYTSTPSCSDTSDSGTNCDANIPRMSQGLLDTSGWYLLDDTHTAVWTSDGWIAPRPAGDEQDGYLFGYNTNYTAALSTLAALTGHAPLLPEYAFGNWFSRYYPYTTSQYENQLLPEFAANKVTLDMLSVDTDWKSPNQWDGWEWNPALFPDPQAFLDWAKQNDVHVTMNIHSSISTSDPQYAKAQSIAGNSLATTNCFSGPCAVWDWAQPDQAESNFALQQPIQNQGVSFWWLDWCCDNSQVSMPGVTPDGWINHLYAQDLINENQRGIALSRIGASLENSVAGTYPAGPWTDHRSAIAFTGDTWSTWNTLAMQAQLASDEASIGQPYVSNDIGGFLGPPNGTPNDPDDIYLRWLQLGTFQPIMREHSNSGQNARLPWDYGAATQATGDAFMRLRESLVPYMYTLAQQASAAGLPMTSALYLDYPALAAAYQHPTEYMLGQNMLVDPVTTPGNVATTSVWFPPGRWTDWFTGATFTGPSTQTLQVPLDRMPVFVKAGGIVPLQPSSGHASSAGSAPLTLRVFAGDSGSYTMYDDAGTGLGYQHSQFSNTTLAYQSGAGMSTVVIGPARGSYPGEPASRQYTVDLVDVSSPDSVLVDGRPAAGWSYDAASHTLHVPVGSVPVGSSATITQTGGVPVQAPEPAATELTINPAGTLTLAAGATTTVTATLANSGPGAVNGVSMSLSAPSGWTVTPTTPTTAASLAAGASLTPSWSVTAPSGSGTQTAALSAAASYTDAATGAPVTVTAQQQPVPVITSVSPPTASAGQVVTVSGVNFGAIQGDSYIKFSDDGTNWGAPGDVATFSLDSWGGNQITFTIPSPSGPGGEYHVTPGSTATVTVTTANGVSGTAQITIGS
jgi:alpha-glucosidase (family GH31 glycosyl hydrolase)